MHRWLKSPTSLLFDPALLRMIRHLMKKLFLSLVGDIKSLGNGIVYASFTKLVLKYVIERPTTCLA